MKNVLVTGAAGFLGSHLCKYHIDRGDTVLGVDNFSSSVKYSDHLSKLLVKKRYYDDSFTFHEADITNAIALKAITEKFRKKHDYIDTIYNFACPASPPRYQAMPIETMLTCTVGVSNVLNVASDHDAVVVHASTSEVYGDPEVSPQPESYRGRVNSYGPRSCYDEGKRAAEALCYDYFMKCKVDARLVRIFNTYGPNMDPYDGRVVSNFIVQAMKGERLTVYGDGSQTRSFCYVDDLIRAIIAMGDRATNPGTPINIGNPDEFTIAALADKVNEKFGSSLGIEFKPLPQDDPLQRKPDISAAKELLGWTPVVSLDQGLEKTIEYFKNINRTIL